ncbi:short-chain dehydrogenase [Desulfonema ishimotonii]|uniref:Short-chain dehydrogenase n=1 Tax=Desulfonema ishimotonii TaxID=45657 RepID=A0A401G2C0_9BACT|nr:MaoC/PaaZ C-terminal domain-containing protein [Desulfonema ishimotonii]GBC63323.1 short-chain dehydrogenase [Desulfonema ishimotonii]
MALNPDAPGKKLGPFTREYTWKDAVLYALGVGAGFSEPEYCYEKNLKVVPSFSIAAIFDLFFEVGRAANVNLAGVLHGEQALIFHAPVPTEGTLSTEGKITHYYDKGEGKGALVVAESETCDAVGQKLFTSTFTLFSRLDGGFGGEDAPGNRVVYPDREPDFAVRATPSEDQPLLYRLSGDLFQLHVDPEFARMAGFERPIMHGLCTHGYACRALIASLTPQAPERVRRFDCRFSSPLYPGVPVETRIWKTGAGKAVWETVNAETGEVVITNGIFEYGDPPQHGNRKKEESPGAAGPADGQAVAAAFKALGNAFIPAAAQREEAVFQFRISGDGGAWYCVVREGECMIRAGVHDAPSCTLEMADADFIAMISGTLPPVQAFSAGKLQISGDVMKALLIEKMFRI